MEIFVICIYFLSVLTEDSCLMSETDWESYLWQHNGEQIPWVSIFGNVFATLKLFQVILHLEAIKEKKMNGSKVRRNYRNSKRLDFIDFPNLLTVTTKADFVIVSGKLIKIMPDSEVSSKIFFLIKK